MADTQSPTKRRSRPLSPHLQVYRWSITMALSIMHRVTGSALAVGSLMVVWFLFSIASGPEAYAQFSACAGSWPGQLVLFGWTLAIYFHLCTGIRHLIMDTGRLFVIHDADRFGLFIIITALSLTALTWAFILR